MLKSFKISLLAAVIATSWSLPVYADSKMESRVQEKKQDIENRIEKIQNESQEKIESLKEKAEKKTDEVRKKACESRQSNITERLKKRSESASSRKSKFDNINQRVREFASKNSLTSVELTNLAAAVDSASAKADDDISVLKNLDVTLDCTMPDEVAQKIESYRAQLETVKSALKNYRDAIRSYAQAVKALAEAKEAQ